MKRRERASCIPVREVSEGGGSAGCRQAGQQTHSVQSVQGVLGKLLPLGRSFLPPPTQTWVSAWSAEKTIGRRPTWESRKLTV